MKNVYLINNLTLVYKNKSKKLLKFFKKLRLIVFLWKIRNWIKTLINVQLKNKNLGFV